MRNESCDSDSQESLYKVIAHFPEIHSIMLIILSYGISTFRLCGIFMALLVMQCVIKWSRKLANVRKPQTSKTAALWSGEVSVYMLDPNTLECDRSFSVPLGGWHECCSSSPIYPLRNNASLFISVLMAGSEPATSRPDRESERGEVCCIVVTSAIPGMQRNQQPICGEKQPVWMMLAKCSLTLS